VIDGDAESPTVVNVSSTTPDGVYGPGSEIAITVAFDEPVVVLGVPRLELETGQLDRLAIYVGGSGSPLLSFLYVVAEGDESSDLDYTGVSALTLGQGTIRDASGNDADLTLPTVGETGSLGANSDLVINTEQGLTVSAGIVSLTPDGTYATGEVISLLITFPDSVEVNGDPRVLLETGSDDSPALYDGKANPTTLKFHYTVANGDLSPDLDCVGPMAFDVNGGSIMDTSGHQIIPVLPVPGSQASLSGRADLVINAVFFREPRSLSEPLRIPPSLTRVFPNPARDATIFRFETSESAEVEIGVFGVAGTLLGKTIAAVDAQNTLVRFETSDLPAGVYFYIVRYRGTQAQIPENRGKIVILNSRRSE
jgi:hypothetical protein